MIIIRFRERGEERGPIFFSVCVHGDLIVNVLEIIEDFYNEPTSIPFNAAAFVLIWHIIKKSALTRSNLRRICVYVCALICAMSIMVHTEWSKVPKNFRVNVNNRRDEHTQTTTTYSKRVNNSREKIFDFVSQSWRVFGL